MTEKLFTGTLNKNQNKTRYQVSVYRTNGPLVLKQQKRDNIEFFFFFFGPYLHNFIISQTSMVGLRLLDDRGGSLPTEVPYIFDNLETEIILKLLKSMM